MLDLAADKISQLHPNLAIIAAIGDDFSRALVVSRFEEGWPDAVYAIDEEERVRRLPLRG